MVEDVTKTTTGTEDLGKQTEPPVLAAKDATKEEVPAQEGQADTTSKVVTYTEDELQKRIESAIGGYKGTQAKIQADLKAAQEAMQRAQVEAEEASYTKFLSEVEKGGGDLDLAKSIVATQKAQNAREAQLRATEATIAEQMAAINEAGKAKKLSDLMAEYKLPESAKEILAQAKDPDAMELQALRMALKKNQTPIPAAKQPDLGAKTGKSGIDWTKLSDTEKFGIAIEQIKINKGE